MATTLNPADIGPNLSLSGGNLTLTRGAGGSGSTWQSVRSTTSQTSGKWYYEMSVTADTSGIMAGVADSIATINGSYIGNNTPNNTPQDSKSYYDAGQFRYGGVGSGSPATYTSGDVIGVALDAGTGNVTYYKNNSSQGTQTDAVNGPYFAGISLLTNNSVIVANFGNTSGTGFSFTPPAGYSGWDFTGGTTLNTRKTLLGVGI